MSKHKPQKLCRAGFYLLVLSNFLTLSAAHCLGSDPTFYPDLNHKVFIESIRAGNHDSSGTNDYFFQFEVRGVKNTQEVKGEEIEKRAYVTSGPSEFTKIRVASLAIWDLGVKDENAASFTITGDAVRELVSKGMRELKVAEVDLGIQVVISMYEKGKWLFFLGEDTLVGKVDYFILPVNKEHVPSRTNLKLEITDPLGTKVSVKVKYEKPLVPKKDRTDSELNKKSPPPQITGEKK